MTREFGSRLFQPPLLCVLDRLAAAAKQLNLMPVKALWHFALGLRFCLRMERDRRRIACRWWREVSQGSRKTFWGWSRSRAASLTLIGKWVPIRTNSILELTLFWARIVVFLARKWGENVGDDGCAQRAVSLCFVCVCVWKQSYLSTGLSWPVFLITLGVM